MTECEESARRSRDIPSITPAFTAEGCLIKVATPTRMPLRNIQPQLAFFSPWRKAKDTQRKGKRHKISVLAASVSPGW